MYIIKASAEFDSAHFLFGYDGKCRNIHGHRWKIEAEAGGEDLCTDKQHSGMIADFGDLKKALREIADELDHTLIYEKNTLKKSTENALSDEGFSLTPVSFRPTAENFARYVFDKMTEKGFCIIRARVYETPENCAVYERERR